MGEVLFCQKGGHKSYLLSAHYGKPEVKFSQNRVHERTIGVANDTLCSCHDISKNSVNHCLKIPFQLALIHGQGFCWTIVLKGIKDPTTLKAKLKKVIS